VSTSAPAAGNGTVSPVAPSTPASSDDYKTLKEQFDNAATSNLGRWVASLTALGIPVVTAFCAWVQKKIGIKLDPAALTAFITSMAVGIALTGYKWLSNHGSWERAMVDAYRVYLTGQNAPTTHVLVVPDAQRQRTMPPTP
jgi:hypothetical protein